MLAIESGTNAHISAGSNSTGTETRDQELFPSSVTEYLPKLFMR